MRTLRHPCEPCRLRGIHRHLNADRINGLQSLRFITHLSVRISLFTAVNRKGDALPYGTPLYIDRRVRIIHESEIFPAGLRNGGIHARFYIIDNHGVVLSLLDFQLRFQAGIVKGGGNLADSSPETLHHCSVQVGTRQFIPIGFGKRRNGLQRGKFFSGIDRCPVDQPATVRDILAAGSAAGGIGGGEGSQDILYLLQGLPVSLRLLLHDTQRNLRVVAACPVLCKRRPNGFLRLLFINLITCPSFRDFKRRTDPL